MQYWYCAIGCFKITYFVATTKGISAKGLAKLFKDNVWKLHGLPVSVILDREPPFVAELIKELNRMLGIETKLLIVFYSQIDRQTRHMNQKLKQYLWFFVDHKQKTSQNSWH